MIDPSLCALIYGLIEESRKVEYPMADAAVIAHTMIAFISDHDDAINQLFDTLKQRTEEAAKKKESVGISCIDVSQKLPLCENLAQIIHGWAAYGWDRTVKPKGLYDIDMEEELEIGVISYINRKVIVRNGSRYISYVHIKPMTIMDLSPCIGVFLTIYLDLCCGHSPVFQIGDEKDRRDGFRCIPYISSPMSGLNPDDWLCLFRNYLSFAEVTGGICCRLDYGEDTKKDGVSYDSATKTVATVASPVRLPDIVNLFAIDPLPFVEEDDTEKDEEDGEDMEYFCQDEKAPTLPGQSSKDAVKVLVRIYTQDFEQIIEKVITETDVTGYETPEDYRAGVREMAENECWTYLDDLLERTGDEAAEDFDVIREILEALNPLVGDLIKYKFSRRLYEIYRAKEQRIARSEHS
ncbi:MAG: hypothetical protein LUD07_11945 [Clostridiales bacterium]|nr:hypothetical protein [Clostridiales bacterium]